MLTGMVSISWPRDPPASASQSAGITGVSHRARPTIFLHYCVFCAQFFLDRNIDNTYYIITELNLSLLKNKFKHYNPEVWKITRCVTKNAFSKDWWSAGNPKGRELYFMGLSLGFGNYFAIIYCWSLECMFHVFLPFYPECNFAWRWPCGNNSTVGSILVQFLL